MRIILWTLVIAIAGAGAWYLWAQNTDPLEVIETDTPSETTDTSMTNGDTTTDTSESGVVVRRTTGGFMPNSVTVPVGTTVTFTNEAESDMWVASAMHPTHAVYDGSTRQEHCTLENQTPFDQCETGNTFSFAFEKAGEWTYHNHVAPNEIGTVIVEEASSE